MTISQALKKYPKIETDLLLAHVLQKPKEFLYLHPETKLTATQQIKLKQLISKRRSGMPIAYLLGYKYFYDLKFKVNKHVLVPRPETEWIVEEALAIIGQKKLKVLDVGTGSGAIAVSIAKHSKAKVVASDISAKALMVARANAKAQKLKIDFTKRNLLTDLRGKFDIIVANLPYVPAKVYKRLYRNLKYEPKHALTDKEKDMALYKRFIDQLPAHLNKNGKVILEIDPSYAKSIPSLLKQKFPRKKINIVKDFRKLNRFVTMY